MIALRRKIPFSEVGSREEIELKRITKDEVLDAPVSAYTGETMLIPITEECVIVMKRLVLVEEVRVNKIRREVRGPQSIKLRRVEIVVDHDTQNRDDQ